MKAIIIGAIVTAGIIISLILLVGNSFDLGSSQKYQYKFWQESVEFENNNDFYRVLFSRSSDYGKTFSEPLDMSMTDQHAHEPKMIIMNGDVILIWRDEVEQPTLSFAKSTDHGETFEKKRLFYGARPDIVYYDDTIYLTYVWGDNVGQIWYSKSNDGSETFSEPKLIFEVDWKLSPYEDRPMPTLEVDANKVAITWKMQDKDNQKTVWKAIDYGKDDNFEITSFLDN